jgi:hypothetical protein
MCGYYWDWEAGKPHVCPNPACKAVTPWVKCEKQVGTRGRQKTPDDWQCPYCKKRNPIVKMYARGVCKPCHSKLTELESAALPKKTPERKAKKRLGRPPKNPDSATPIEEENHHTADWWCADCGAKMPQKRPKCTICYDFCQGCEKYKPLHKRSLCKECYDMAYPQKAPETPPAALPEKPNTESSESGIIEEGPKRRGRRSKKPSDLVKKSLKLTRYQIEKLEEMIEFGKYPDMDEAVRVAVRDLIMAESFDMG